MANNQILSKEELLERYEDLQKEYRKLNKDYVLACKTNNELMKQIEVLNQKLGIRVKNESKLQNFKKEK